MSQTEDIIEIIAEQLGVDKAEVKPESSIVDDLGADSLDLTELIMTLESRFNCEISEEEAAKLRTVNDVITYIQNH